MKYFKFVLFYLYASFVPFYIKPKKCYVIDRGKCPIWTCEYHYKDGRYDDCQKKEVNGYENKDFC